MFVFRLIRKLFFLAILLVVVLFFTRHYFFRAGLEWAAWYYSGFTLKVASADVTGLNPVRFTATGLQLENPPGFNQRVAASGSFAEVIFLPRNEAGWPPRIDRLRLVLDEVVLEKNREGDVNLLEIKGAKNALIPFQTHPSGPPWIGELDLSVQRLLYFDYTHQKNLMTPEPQTFDVALHHKKFKDIADVRELEAVILRALTDLAQERLDHHAEPDNTSAVDPLSPAPKPPKPEKAKK